MSTRPLSLWNCVGHLCTKDRVTGWKMYHGRLARAGGPVRITLRRFKTATAARAYGVALAARYRRMVIYA